MSRTGDSREQKLSLFPASKKKGGIEIKNRKTGHEIRAPTGQRTAQTLTTEYRRAAELTQRGDTAFHTGRFFYAAATDR